MEKQKTDTAEITCERRCPWHGDVSVRGRHFQGNVIKIIGQRAVVTWERIVYYPKYERYAKTKSKVHAYMPKCIFDSIKIGDYVEVGECRPLSKIMHFKVLKKISEEKK